MLLPRTERLPEGPDWAYELKLDGYRALAFKSYGAAHLRSRNNKSFDSKYPAIVQALAALLSASQLSIEHPDDARAALREYQDGADFADSLIAAANSRAGCEYTATFDRRAARRSGFRLIK